MANLIKGQTLLKVTAADAGKVLIVQEDGSIGLSEIEGLPAAKSTDAGSVPTVQADGSYKLAAIPTELPAVTAENNGNVLKVVDGAWAVAAP